MNIIKIKKWKDIPKNFTGVVETDIGGRFWYKDDKLHRVDGPACEYASKEKEWYLQDQYYAQIVLENYIILDYAEGEYGIMWYKLLSKNQIINYPDIPGLITKE